MSDPGPVSALRCRANVTPINPQGADVSAPAFAPLGLATGRNVEQID